MPADTWGVVYKVSEGDNMCDRTTNCTIRKKHNGKHYEQPNLSSSRIFLNLFFSQLDGLHSNLIPVN